MIDMEMGLRGGCIFCEICAELAGGGEDAEGVDAAGVARSFFFGGIVICFWARSFHFCLACFREQTDTHFES